MERIDFDFDSRLNWSLSLDWTDWVDLDLKRSLNKKVVVLKKELHCNCNVGLQIAMDSDLN